MEMQFGVFPAGFCSWFHHVFLTMTFWKGNSYPVIIELCDLILIFNKNITNYLHRQTHSFLHTTPPRVIKEIDWLTDWLKEHCRPRKHCSLLGRRARTGIVLAVVPTTEHFKSGVWRIVFVFSLGSMERKHFYNQLFYYKLQLKEKSFSKENMNMLFDRKRFVENNSEESTSYHCLEAMAAT